MSLAPTNLKPTALEALIRFAIHFFIELESYNDQYILGGGKITQALSRFDKDWPNIAHAQRAIADLTSKLDQKTISDTNYAKAAIELCNAFPDAGAYLISLRLNAMDRIKWLEAALSASIRLQRGITTQAHLGNLGLAYYETGHFERSIAYFEEARKLALRIGDRRHEGTWIGNIGNVLAATGNHRKAIEHHERHRRIAQEIGDLRGEANALGNLGVSCNAIGEKQPAVRYYQQQLEIAQQIGDHRGMGYALLNIGLSHHDSSDFAAARPLLEQSLEIARQIGDQELENLTLGSLGHLLLEIKEYLTALENLSAAIQISQRIVDIQGEVRHRSVQMLAHQRAGQFTQAIKIGEDALELASKMKIFPEAVFINWQLGLIYEYLGDMHRAMDCFRMVSKYDIQIGNPNAKKAIEKLQSLSTKIGLEKS